MFFAKRSTRQENIMRATTAASSVWRAYAIAFGLGLAIAGMGAGLAHAADGNEAAAPQIQIAQGLLPVAPNNAFVCHAQPGGWCDLRDWTPAVHNPITPSAY
jgi:hypothetical protein